MGLSQEESLGEGGKKMDKCCSDCKTTKTPLWRGGPAGPKSLCNACGIRFRKKRRSELGLNKGGTGKKKERTSDSTNITGSTVATAVGDHSEEEGGLSESVKMGLMAFSKEVLMQQRSSSSSPPPPFWFASPVKRQRSKRKLREEELAAVLLMSLSCGSVFA